MLWKQSSSRLLAAGVVTALVLTSLGLVASTQGGPQQLMPVDSAVGAAGTTAPAASGPQPASVGPAASPDPHPAPLGIVPGEFAGSASPAGSSVGSVTDTLVLSNGTVVPGNFLPRNGVAPAGLAYDTLSGYVYLADSSSDNVAVVDGGTGTVVGFVPVGADPWGVAHDSANGHIYVANSGSGNVTVIDGITNTVVGSIPVGTDPIGVAYDGANGQLYVTNYGSNNVSVIDGATDTVVASVAVPPAPWGVAYDSVNNGIYVTSQGSGYLTLIRTATNTIAYYVDTQLPYGSMDVTCDSANGWVYVGSVFDLVTVMNATGSFVRHVTVGNGAQGVTYDPVNGQVYVANMLSDNVTILDGSTSHVVGSIPAGSEPYATLYDALNGHLYVANFDSSNVTIINATTDRVIGSTSVGSVPDAVVGGGRSGRVYVAEPSAGTVLTLDGTTGQVVGAVADNAFPDALTYDPVSGHLFVANAMAGDVMVIDGGTESVVGSIPVGAYPDAATYDPMNGYLYVANGASNNVTVIDTATDAVITSVPVGTYPDGMAYDPANGYVYVANFVSNNTTVIDTATSTVAGSIPTVGAGPVGVGYDPANGHVYVAVEIEDAITVIDGSTNAVIGSVPVGTYPTAVAYDAANGFVYSADWGSSTVTVVDGSNDTVVGSVPVGSHPFSVASDRASGLVFVANQYSGSVSLLRPAGVFVASVTFTEVGLPAKKLTHHGWRVTLDGVSQETTGPSMTFDLLTGDHPVLVTGPRGFTSNASGTLPVRGNMTVTVGFVQHATVVLRFHEKGLPKSSPWCVALQNYTRCSTTHAVKFMNLTAGMYSYRVVSPTKGQVITARIGQAPMAPAGAMTLTGRTSVHLQFVYPYAVTFTEVGLPNGTAWSLTVHHVTHYSTTTTIVFDLGNRSYPYAVQNALGYAFTKLSRKAIVAGGPTSLTIAFRPTSTSLVPVTPTPPATTGTSPAWEAALAASALAGAIVVLQRTSTRSVRGRHHGAAQDHPRGGRPTESPGPPTRSGTFPDES